MPTGCEPETCLLPQASTYNICLCLRSTFELFGTDSIPCQVSQVGDVLRALGQNPTEGDVRKLVQSTKVSTARLSPRDRNIIKIFIKEITGNFHISFPFPQSGGGPDSRVTFETFLPLLQVQLASYKPPPDVLIRGCPHFWWTFKVFSYITIFLINQSLMQKIPHNHHSLLSCARRKFSSNPKTSVFRTGVGCSAKN